MNKVYNLLGLASRARKLSSGDLLISTIRSRKASIVIIGSDASDNTIKKITDKCKFYDVEYIVYGTTDELSKAIGKINRVAVGVLDSGFSKKIKENIGG